MHVKLPDNKIARTEIINIFQQDLNADEIVFPESGFSAKECLINGKSMLFADYIAQHELDIKLPLVADYSGAQINISFQSIDNEKKEVHFYAPVFKGTVYKQASKITNYRDSFNNSIPKELNSESIEYSCNCILNYLYGELEGNKIALNGSMTFGEIAYQLLNQTFVYLVVE